MHPSPERRQCWGARGWRVAHRTASMWATRSGGSHHALNDARPSSPRPTKNPHPPHPKPQIPPPPSLLHPSLLSPPIYPSYIYTATPNPPNPTLSLSLPPLPPPQLPTPSLPPSVPSHSTPPNDPLPSTPPRHPHRPRPASTPTCISHTEFTRHILFIGVHRNSAVRSTALTRYRLARFGGYMSSDEKKQ